MILEMRNICKDYPMGKTVTRVLRDVSLGCGRGRIPLPSWDHPGSGKTTVLVNRIANLIRFGAAHGSKQLPRPATEEDVKALKTAIMTGTDAPAWLDGCCGRTLSAAGT